MSLRSVVSLWLGATQATPDSGPVSIAVKLAEIDMFCRLLIKSDRCDRAAGTELYELLTAAADN